nr:hypothetical protein CFP56_34709 [Quercus suber]
MRDGARRSANHAPDIPPTASRIHLEVGGARGMGSRKGGQGFRAGIDPDLHMSRRTANDQFARAGIAHHADASRACRTPPRITSAGHDRNRPQHGRWTMDEADDLRKPPKHAPSPTSARSPANATRSETSALLEESCSNSSVGGNQAPLAATAVLSRPVACCRVPSNRTG